MNIVSYPSLTAETTIPGELDDITSAQVNQAAAEVLRKAADRISRLNSDRYSVRAIQFDFDLEASNDMAVHVYLHDIEDDTQLEVIDEEALVTA